MTGLLTDRDARQSLTALTVAVHTIPHLLNLNRGLLICAVLFCFQVLRELVKEVHVIPVDERYPDAVFVEDPVVVCGDTALLPILGVWSVQPYPLP